MLCMTTVPDRARVRLPGISSRAHEHPADRTALGALRKLTGHAVYRTMLLTLTDFARRLVWFAIGYLSLRAFILALEEWFRKSELSCDRAGVLAGQDPAAGRRALMKLAGGSRMSELSHDEFLRQAEEDDAVADVRESIIKILILMGNTHPFAAGRSRELDRWVSEE